jgi:hypothetical protein
MRFGRSKIFSSFDLMKRYYQVAMKEEDKGKPPSFWKKVFMNSMSCPLDSLEHQTRSSV